MSEPSIYIEPTVLQLTQITFTLNRFLVRQWHIVVCRTNVSDTFGFTNLTRTKTSFKNSRRPLCDGSLTPQQSHLKADFSWVFFFTSDANCTNYRG